MKPLLMRRITECWQPWYDEILVFVIESCPTHKKTQRRRKCNMYVSNERRCKCCKGVLTVQSKVVLEWSNSKVRKICAFAKERGRSLGAERIDKEIEVYVW